jgi:hypothetical protein
MDGAQLSTLIARLRASGFSELAGARATLSLPISEPLLNELVAAVVPASAPVRGLRIQLHPGNRLTVNARVLVSSWLPEFPVSAPLEIERQPRLPDSPLVLRMSPGLVSIAARFLSGRAPLPPGVRIVDERILVDLPVLLESRGFAEVLAYADEISVTTEAGKLIVNASARVARL